MATDKRAHGIHSLATDTGEDNCASFPQKRRSVDHEMIEKEVWKQRDVALYKPSTNILRGETLASQETAIIHDVKQTIGKNQVTSSAIAFAPGWIVEKAMKAEHDENWVEAYEEVPESGLRNNADVISSHLVFKVKTNDDGSLKLKGRIVVYGNRDPENNSYKAIAQRRTCSSSEW